MDDKLKVFWNLDVLVKMCRSKSDGPSLRIEEEEILNKIETSKQEIEDIKALTEEESYDTSAEMADRNIEIITKKQLQTLKTSLKDKNKELNLLKGEEQHLYLNNSLLREQKNSQEKYITSMQERINEATDYEVVDRYNGLIAETTEKISILVDELEEQNNAYEKVQADLVALAEEIANIEDKIDKKKKLLAETQANLENKDNYIDKSKKEKNDKKIYELESKIQKATSRLEEIRKDPKYIESKIKDIFNNKEDISTSKPLFIDLLNIVLKQPYINVPADNALEEELLKATQARDTFANEIEQKSYNILEANTPEKIRIEFLNERITLWHKELEELQFKVDTIDRDREYSYEVKNQALQEMIDTMKKDLREFERAYKEVPEINVGAKASVKAAMDEKRVDIIEAEKIATAFRKDESEDIARATRTIKYECDKLNQNIYNAEKEIEAIRNRLTSKKSGLIDISSKNKDKDTLKELAQIVIDIKHRRQFPETPLEIIKRLEDELGLKLLKDLDTDLIDKSSEMIRKDYDEYQTESLKDEPKRGLKVVEETEVEPVVEEEQEDERMQEAEAELHSLIENIEAASSSKEPKVDKLIEEETDDEIEESTTEVIDESSEESSEQTANPTPVEAPVIEEQSINEEPIAPEVQEEVLPTPEEQSTIEEPIVSEIQEKVLPTLEEQSPVEEKVIEEIVTEPITEEIQVVETPIVEEPQETLLPVVEEPATIAEETSVVVEEPIIEEVVETATVAELPVVEQPVAVEASVVEEVVEPTPVVAETPVAEPAPIVEPQPVTPPATEEVPVVETPLVVEETPVVPLTDIPNVSEVQIEQPVAEEQPEMVSIAEVAPVEEQSPVEEPTPVIVEEIPVVDNSTDQAIDADIDNIISTNVEEPLEDQPLDIDAMFEEKEAPVVEPTTTEKPKKKLSIDSIFNVETDENGENTDATNLADDFDQYLNDLGNK